MWEPRVAAEGWAWFTAAYLAGIIAVIAIVTVIAVRFRLPLRQAVWIAGGCVVCSVALFLWLVGAPLWSALLLGAGTIPVVLVAVGGLGSGSTTLKRDSDAH
jgi:hypothetical protein